MRRFRVTQCRPSQPQYGAEKGGKVVRSSVVMACVRCQQAESWRAVGGVQRGVSFLARRRRRRRQGLLRPRRHSARRRRRQAGARRLSSGSMIWHRCDQRLCFGRQGELLNQLSTLPTQLPQSWTNPCVAHCSLALRNRLTSRHNAAPLWTCCGPIRCARRSMLLTPNSFC